MDVGTVVPFALSAAKGLKWSSDLKPFGSRLRANGWMKV